MSKPVKLFALFAPIPLSPQGRISVRHVAFGAPILDIHVCPVIVASLGEMRCCIHDGDVEAVFEGEEA